MTLGQKVKIEVILFPSKLLDHLTSTHRALGTHQPSGPEVLDYSSTFPKSKPELTLKIQIKLGKILC